jgi:hypothetical protein
MLNLITGQEYIFTKKVINETTLFNGLFIDINNTTLRVYINNIMHTMPIDWIIHVESEIILTFIEP